MEIWYTWLGFIGLIAGLVVAAVYEWPPARSALVGFAGGLALVTVVNFVVPKPTTCLQNSKGWDILRAYSLKCPDPNENLLPRR